MTILAIETSCDDTAASVVSDGRVLSNIISSQAIHDTYGGIVPELASREHVKAIAPITAVALREAQCGITDVDAIAVTYGPGLAGSLVVGLQFAKGLAMRHATPLIPIHHIEAHVYSGFMDRADLTFPAIVLVVSGGHTSIFHVTSYDAYTVIGSTRDDAAGEAFDKVSKMLGLGYPGGPHIDRHAAAGNGDAYAFPRGLLHDGTYNFSFSGLKTSVRYFLRDHAVGAADGPTLADVCASVQRAIVDVLVHKTMAAADAYNVRSVVIAGGVSANTELRQRMQAACEKAGRAFAAPDLRYSVDNAAMIGFLAERRMPHTDLQRGLDISVEPNAIRSR